MNQNDFQFDERFDEYDEYEALFDPTQHDRRARRKRKAKANHQPKKSHDEVLAEMVDPNELDPGFGMTYEPSRHESGWLMDSIRQFYDQSLIVDVLAQVKGGKEASVYRCQANPNTGQTLLAAKVYRPRMFRNLRNDKLYQEGREILGPDGRPLKDSDRKAVRAIGKKTSFAEQLTHTSWLMYEYNTLDMLYKAGAAVPQPFAASQNAILMGYCGDEAMAAPTLHEVVLEPDEAIRLFHEVMRNITLMLNHGFIHGDLSAYNILYWEGEITLIDFPQVVDCRGNSQADFILQRDVERVCDYFLDQGVDLDTDAIFEGLWRHYLAKDPEDIEADMSRLEAED